MSHAEAPPVTVYGVMAEFESPEALVAAARAVRELGYKKFEAYSSIPVEGLLEAMGDTVPSRVPRFVLGAGLAGCFGAMAMQVIACVFHYRENVGGKGFFSWPAFIPVTYELTILSASFAALAGFFLLCGLPELNHPVFNVPRFERASREGYFLCLETADPLYHAENTKQFLQTLSPLDINEVPA